MTLYLVQFECGCIGFPNYGDPEVKGDEEALIVQYCDADDEKYGLGIRNMTGKKSVPVKGEKAETIIREIGILIGRGYALQQVSNTLKWASERVG